MEKLAIVVLALVTGIALGAVFALLATFLLNIVLAHFGVAPVPFLVVWAALTVVGLLRRAR